MKLNNMYHRPLHPEELNPGCYDEIDPTKWVNGTEYELDCLGQIVCPFCGDAEGVDEDQMFCMYCKEHI